MRAMLRSRAIPIALVLALFLAGASASAVTFDFGRFAANELPPQTASAPQGEGGYTSFSWTIAGLTVTATGSHNGNSAFAYLDGRSSNRLAGLGVCQELEGGSSLECDPSSDDNVTSGETLSLAFSSGGNPIQVTIDIIKFRNADHFALFGTNDKFWFNDGSGFEKINFPLNGQWSPVGATGTIFDFMYKNEQFYISKMDVTPEPIPEPASLVLLGSGLAGLALRRRRRSH